MVNDTAGPAELAEHWRRARNGLREAIELATAGWDRARRPRAGEREVWTPRQVAEHAIAADVSYAAIVAHAIGAAAPERTAPVLPSAAAALGACAQTGELADTVLAQLDAGQLILETELGVEIGDVLRGAAAHLREHARQIAGVEQR
jgi:hypothetical protein